MLSEVRRVSMDALLETKLAEHTSIYQKEKTKQFQSKNSKLFFLRFLIFQELQDLKKKLRAINAELYSLSTTLDKIKDTNAMFLPVFSIFCNFSNFSGKCTIRR
jgi:hypothetical protein